MAQLQLRFHSNLDRSALEDLSRALLFATLPKDGSLERLAELVWLREFRAGETLLHFNQIQTAVLIFVEGRAVGSREQRVAICDAGSVFGETALIDALPSEIKLTAETDGALWQLDAAAFDQFGQEYPKAALALTSTIARNVLRKTKEAQARLRLF